MTLKSPKIRSYLLPALLPVQFALVKIMGLFPDWIESWYSNGLYVWTSKSERWLFGWIPFSIGDIGYGLLLFFCLRWLWKGRKSWKLSWVSNLRKITALASVLYFFFHFFWAMNYYRVRLHEKLGLEKDYDSGQLYEFTEKLIEHTNGLHLDITGNRDSIVRVPYSRRAIFDKGISAYAELEQSHPEFHLENESVKKSLYSLPLSVMGFAGYLNPFTNEAQVNGLGPLYSFGATSCHEMAHQIGYALENEANFVGYLASVHSEDPYLQYSGYTMAVKYCLRSLMAYDEEKGEFLLKQVNPGIRKNFEESRRFSEKYSSFIDVVFEFIYDRFLKMNDQDDGMESYNRFVDLLVNYHLKKNFGE